MTVAGRAGLRGRGQDLAFTGREVGAPVSRRWAEAKPDSGAHGPPPGGCRGEDRLREERAGAGVLGCPDRAAPGEPRWVRTR